MRHTILTERNESNYLTGWSHNIPPEMQVHMYDRRVEWSSAEFVPTDTYQSDVFIIIIEKNLEREKR